MLQIKEKEKSGFDTLFTNERFKCAFISHSPMYSYGEVQEMKRHNETDEIFTLISGKATMLIYENGVFSETELEKNKAYNVLKGTYHYLAVSENALVFVCENADTTAQNSEVTEVKYNLK